MNKQGQSYQKQYRFGLSALLVMIVLAVWFVRQEQSGMPDSVSPTAGLIEAGPFNMRVTLMPDIPRVGDNRLLIEINDRKNQPLNHVRLKVVATMPAVNSKAVVNAQGEVAALGNGRYQAGIKLTKAGRWRLIIEAATDDSHHVDLLFELETGRKGLQLSSSTPAGDVAYYTCSMHPSVRSAAPGTCPICGMDLVPVTQEEQQSGEVIVEEGRRQIIGIKTSPVIRAAFSVPLYLYGEVRYADTGLTDISLHFDGWIGELKAGYEGQSIQRGEVLFTVYSPELLSLQEEYLQTLRYSRHHSGRQRAALIAASRKRLGLWGLSQEQIRWLSRQGKAVDYLPIFSPVDGVLLKKNIIRGSFFKRGQSLLQLADPAALWIEAYAYEQDLPLIRADMKATVRLTNLNRDFDTTVMQVDPFVGGAGRMARLRLSAADASGWLKAGMYAQVTLHANFGEQLLVPDQAILVAGEKRLVFVDRGNGRLKPVRIRTGYSDGVHTIVRKGLKAGDRVVIAGNFLIAAESKLKSGVEQW